MGTIVSLVDACLARSTKLSSIKPLRFSNERGSRFDYAGVSNLGMYLHIPTRIAACAPEGSDRAGESDASDCRAVLEHLLSAIHSAGSAAWKDSRSAAPRDRKTITTLFIKGNTALLDAPALESIVCAVRERFTITHGIGFELASTELESEKLRMLYEAGISHLAVTVASRPCVQKPVDTPDAAACGMLSVLKEAPFETVSLTFAFAQPGQTSHQLKHSIEAAFASGANHIAIKPFNSREAKRLEAGHRTQPVQLVEFGCATTTLAQGTFGVNAYSITEYGKRIGAGKPPAAVTLRIVERERMLRYVLWAAHDEARLLLAQAKLLRGIGRSQSRKQSHKLR
ncbi:hypothetical protein [Raoultibacter phocaeensis]|uniref:hypothetical protein n=1 Tax=Raoultibacter phocaeensis TaxID=2479841 RepID=UPI0011198127|nr:hypothetical protein [Raoultibacter phocaeensis]